MVVLCLRLFIDLFPFCSLFLYAVLRLSQSRPRHPAHGRWIPALRLRYQRSQSQRLGHQRKYLYLLRPGIAVAFEDVYVYGWMVYVCDADFLLPSEQHTSARQREMRVMDFCGKEREPKGRDNDLQTIRRSSKVVLADVIVPEQMGQEQRERANDPCYSLSLCLDPFQSPGGLILFWGRSLLTLFAVCGFAPVALSLRNQLRPGVFHEGDGARPLATPVRLPVLLIICYSFCPSNRELTITNNPPK